VAAILLLLLNTFRFIIIFWRKKNIPVLNANEDTVCDGASVSFILIAWTN